MARLIDADVVLDIIRDYFAGLIKNIAEEYGADEIPMGVINPYFVMNKALRTMVRQTPTVDAVEVVRCKDCKYYFEQPRGFSPICELTRSRAEKEGFCSWGKKKDE